MSNESLTFKPVWRNDSTRSGFAVSKGREEVTRSSTGGTMYFSARTGLQFAAPVAAVVLLSSCMPQAGQRLTPFRSFTQFSEPQITAVNPITAYDAVLRLRPTAPSPAGGSSFEPTVYLDNLKLGGPEELTRISAIDIIGIRFLTPIEASARFGPSFRGGGAILLTTRIGRRQSID